MYLIALIKSDQPAQMATTRFSTFKVERDFYTILKLCSRLGDQIYID